MQPVTVKQGELSRLFDLKIHMLSHGVQPNAPGASCKRCRQCRELESDIIQRYNGLDFHYKAGRFTFIALYSEGTGLRVTGIQVYEVKTGDANKVPCGELCRVAMSPEKVVAGHIAASLSRAGYFTDPRAGRLGCRDTEEVSKARVADEAEERIRAHGLGIVL